jgi:hypothetical protein
MRTKKQIEASRRNGAKSKGPVTPEGKARVARNAITHGLSAAPKPGAVVVLDTESDQEFDDLLNSYREIHRPANLAEERLVFEIAAAQWRIQRAITMETAAINHEVKSQKEWMRGKTSDDATSTAIAFGRRIDTLTAMQNYEARLRRSSARATADLLRLQTIRKAAQAEADEEAAADALAGHEPAAGPESGESVIRQNKPGDEQPSSMPRLADNRLIVMQPPERPDRENVA